MKKGLALFLSAVMVLSFTACGKDTTPATTLPTESTPTTEPSISHDVVSLAGIREDIAADFTATAETLAAEWEEVRTATAGTYDGYTRNKQELLDWYEFVHTQSSALYARGEEKAVEYYKLIAETIDHEDDDALDDVTDELYEAVYEDSFDDLYDAVYEELYDEIYDEYYEGSIDAAEDSMDYADWLDVRSDFYGTWIDERSDFYSEWIQARSDFYGTWFSVRTAFRSGNFDVDSIIAENTEDEEEPQPTETAKPSESEEGPSLEATPVDGVEHEADGFLYIVLTDGTIEITKYIGTDREVSISSEIDDYEVSRIGASAFEGCSQIEEIYLWADVIYIGEAAFKDCTALEEFSVPSSVTLINNFVFENCTSLEEVYMWGDVTRIGEAAFRNCTSLDEVSISSSCTIVGRAAFEGCSDLNDVYMWGGEIIEERAFMNCTSLREISIPYEVTSIGASAFEGCTSLEEIFIWRDDVIFGANVFANCPKLSELPDGAT